MDPSNKKKNGGKLWKTNLGGNLKKTKMAGEIWQEIEKNWSKSEKILGVVLRYFPWKGILGGTFRWYFRQPQPIYKNATSHYPIGANKYLGIN